MAEQQEERVRVGVGVMILKNNKVLLGIRKGSHGAGEYAFPGGHLEYMESFEECARREVREETGMEIGELEFSLLANIKEYKPKHYVHVGLIAKWVSGEPRVMEPDKCEGWAWYDLDNLPEGVFGPAGLAFEAMRSWEEYYDANQVRELIKCNRENAASPAAEGAKK